MRKKLIRFLSLLMLCVFVIQAMPVQATTGDAERIRVGLFYQYKTTDTRLTAGNLQNNTDYGEGFRFGYLTDSLDFVELGRTSSDVSLITIARTSILYRNGNNYSLESNSAGNEIIGVYHLALSESYTSFASASAVAQQYTDGFVAWINGTYEVRIGMHQTKDMAITAQASLGVASEIVGTSSYGMNVFRTGSSEILFQFDGGADSPFAVAPDVNGLDITRTWFRGYRYNGMFQYERIGGGDLTIANVVDLETYVKGVIPFEMSNSWPLEALKAQAVAARTYGQIKINGHRHQSSNFEICNTVDCQVYRGLGSNAASQQATAVTDRAVDETGNMFLWYDGRLAETFYSSSHGGASEDAYHVWGSSREQYPYLGGVIDPYEQLVSDRNSYSSWTRTFTKQQITNMLDYPDNGSMEGIEAIYSKTGNVIKLIVSFENGTTRTFRPDSIRSSSYWNLPSIRFTINGQQVTGDMVTEDTVIEINSTKVNGTDVVDSFDSIYAIDGDNRVQEITSDNAYVITDDGRIEAFDPTPSVPDVDSNGDYSGSTNTTADVFVFEGSGWGHSIGMSQWGAYAMADKMDFQYDAILEFYFPGTYISETGSRG